MRNLPFGKPIIGEEERNAVMDVLRGPQLVHGPRAERFEADFAAFVGGGRALSVASCTAGLHLAYVYLGIGRGDEVIVPAQTHVATAHAVEYTGAKPVFVDVVAETGNIDIDQIEAAIGPGTRAICVVHYLGLPVDMDRVNALARKHDLFVVEDCALSIGGRYKGVHTGLLGDVGAFSFYPVKHITTAEGGIFLSRRPEITEQVQKIKSFGYDKPLGERVVPGLYDVNRLGYNYRMNEMEAALGIEQLKRVPGFLRKRRENDTVLRHELADIREISLLGAGGGDYEHANYCMGVVLSEAISSRRFDILASLRNAGVGTSVYYPGPVPHLTYYKEKYGWGAVPFPNATRISDQSIALSVGPHLDSDDMCYIAAALKSAIKGVLS